MSVRDYLVCDVCGASVPLHDDCKGWSHLEVYDGGRGMELHFCPACTERIIADSKEGGRMSATLNGQTVGFMLKERLGWDRPDVFPSTVELEHDCDRGKPYMVDGHVFYDRSTVRYVPERTCQVVSMDAAGNHPYRKGNWMLNDLSDGCSECGYPFDTLNRGKPNYCPNCGAKVVDE